MSFRTQASMVFHRYLRVPYTLHTHEFRSPKKPKATFVLIHGIGNSIHSWDEVVEQMPKDVRIIGIDLLGFGKSPMPSWAAYDAKTQARSVGMTLLGHRIAQQPILVGHSLGALVAVEVARRYTLLPQRLVLCSPPFYKPSSVDEKGFSADEALKSLYKVAKNHPEQLEQLAPIVLKLGLANKGFAIDSENVGSYIAALESSIINQTSLQDISELKLPIDIFYGMFDPVVVKKHIVNLEKTHDNITATRLATAHEIKGSYIKSLAKYLSTLSKTRE